MPYVVVSGAGGCFMLLTRHRQSWVGFGDRTEWRAAYAKTGSRRDEALACGSRHVCSGSSIRKEAVEWSWWRRCSGVLQVLSSGDDGVASESLP